MELASDGGQIMPSPLIDPIFDGLARALDVHHRRHDVLATNLANVETPGFRAQEVDFRSALARAFERTEQPRPAELVEDASAPARADGNTVDLDLQMAKLAENAGRYTALARILGKRIGLVRLAVDGGR
jgi:flagellar basal-body rod protein FlgB